MITLINYKKLLLVVILAMFSCNDKSNDKSLSTKLPAQVKIKKWQKVSSGANFQPTNNEINHLALSDNKWLYASSYQGGKIWAVNATNIADIFIDTKWKTLLTNNTQLTPQGAGKIPDLTIYGDRISRLTPTSLGVLVSMFAYIAVLGGGSVSLIEGNAFKAAWAPGDLTRMSMWAFGGVLSRPDKTQYVYAGTQSGIASFVTSGEDISKSSIVGPLAVNYTASTPFNGSPNFFANTTTKAYVIDNTGARAYNNAADVGTATPLPDASPAAKASRWAGEDGTGNYSINTAIGVGDYLYIGFDVLSGSHGGVFLLNAAKDVSFSVHKDWKNIAVLAFAVDKAQQVWAVTEKALFLVNKDGSKGENFKDTLDEPLAKNSMPIDKISGAQFSEDALIISSTNEGIIVGLTTN